MQKECKADGINFFDVTSAVDALTT